MCVGGGGEGGSGLGVCPNPCVKEYLSSFRFVRAIFLKFFCALQLHFIGH